MKPLARIFCLLILGGWLAGELHAQALWPPTTAGQPLEVIQKLFPESHAPENAEPLPSSSVVQLLELDHVVIADRTFRVKFYFNAERLVKVTLLEAGEVVNKDFDRIRDLLRAKYGLEYSTTSSESIQLNWKAVQTAITLKWTPARRDAAMLVLTYEAPVPKETDRL